jgi:cysteine-rich repeat protein
MLGPIVQELYQTCDDGNHVNDDGCSAICRDEPRAESRLELEGAGGS